MKEIMTLKFVLNLLLFGFFGNLMSFGYIWSGEYTIMSHVNIFNNLGGVLIIIGCLIMRKAVHRFELVGTGIALLGCVITALDSKAEKVNSAK